MCERSGKPPEEVFEYLIECGLGSTPGTAAEVLHDGVRRAHLAEQASGRSLGRDHRGLAPHRPALDRHGHVRPHRGAVGAGRAHAGRARAAGAHGRLHRVRAAQLHPVPHAARAARTAIEEISREENLKHTAVFRLALGETVTNLQASWVKMGLDAATESLRWGVNDLGGTLMEESISRMAGSYHGVQLEPRAADRGGAARRAHAGAARHAVQDPRDLLTTVRAVVLRPPGPVEDAGRSSCTTWPCPSRGRGRCWCRVRACAVCRTDLHVVEGELPDPKRRRVPGHQVVGDVERLGEGVRGLAVGRARRACRGSAATDGTLPLLPRRAREPLRRARPSPATRATAATPSTRWRAPTSASRCRRLRRLCRRRRCCARG